MSENGAKGPRRPAGVPTRARTRNPKTGLWTDRPAVSGGAFKAVRKSTGTRKRLRREY